jgi:(2Fe-2S) ferredoxin
MSYYRHHMFFCTNERDQGRKCCQDADATEMVAHAKQRTKELKLNGPGKARISASGCMDRCGLGPVIAIYPEAVWYTYAGPADIDEIINEHLVNGRVVERLRLPERMNARVKEDQS